MLVAIPADGIARIDVLNGLFFSLYDDGLNTVMSSSTVWMMNLLLFGLEMLSLFARRYGCRGDPQFQHGPSYR